MAQQGEVWIFAEQRDGNLMTVSLELLNKGKELAGQLSTPLAAVLLGEQVDDLAQQLVGYGAQKVYALENKKLKFYQSGAYARLIAELIGTHRPELFLLGATMIGMDLAPRVAAKVKTGLTAHCSDLYLEEMQGQKKLIAAVPGWGGNFVVKIACPKATPQMATVRSGVFEKPAKMQSGNGQIVKIAAAITSEDELAETVEMVESQPTGLKLEDADIVVGGGWGFQSVGGFRLAEELAGTLGGATAGSRPAVDAGWVKEDRMIGSSGKTIAPKLFISAGASGAMHFTTGFSKAKVIVAIDQNPKAPIFEVADIGLVGDLGKIIPCFLQELRKEKSGV
ncbi:MAG TPA: electron transfer flavoprotein subunit alpha/FixB family protein [Syntrophales bacterium]|nr:electron transfer flavoprotein subunit alpha/FixB family protein [Syntrophales bacterium]